MDQFQSNPLQSLIDQPQYEYQPGTSIIFKEESLCQQFTSEEIIYPWPLQNNQSELMDNQIQIPKTPRKKRKKQLNYERKKAAKKKNKPIPFSFYEDQAIFNHVFQFGPKFQKISKLFPGRTDSMVKNRYYKTLRFQWEMFEQQYIFPAATIVKPIDNNLQETLNYQDFNLKDFLEQ